MSEAKFTKGEWVADIRGGCCAVYEKSREIDTNGMHSDDERNIYFSNSGAKYDGNSWSMSEEAIANAHLIAAAPEMYEMLDALCTYLIDLDSLGTTHKARQIEKLLAKARGGL